MSDHLDSLEMVHVKEGFCCLFFTLETRLALNSGLSLFLNPSRSVESHSGKSIASEPERALMLCILGQEAGAQLFPF